LRIVAASMGFETMPGALAMRTFLSFRSLQATKDMTMVCT
jgi:hypothetical protein